MKIGKMFFAMLVMSAALSTSAPAQMKARLNWTAVTGAQSGAYVAQEEGLFKKHGVEIEMIHIASSSRGIQAILAGEIAFSYMDGSNAAQANLKGAGLALVAGATNRMVFSLMARPEFKKIADLRGKKVGIRRAYIRANEDTVRRVVRAYAEGLHLFKTNKQVGLRVRA